MTRCRRISLALAAAAAVPAVLLGSAAPATAAPTAAPASAPGAGVAAAEWRFVANYAIARWCQDAGTAGVQNGDWAEYLCIPRLVGLDVRYWSLYVSP